MKERKEVTCRFAVTDADGKDVERYVYDPAGNILEKTVGGRKTTCTYDAANQLVSSTDADGKTTKYQYDAVGRLVKEGARTYRYGYLDKVLSVTEGKTRTTYSYHVDGQLASATKHQAGKAPTGRAVSPLTAKTEEFFWDGLALVRRGGTSYVNEPHPGGGAAVLSSKDGVMFNDILGTTLGVDGESGYTATPLTAFGDATNYQLPTANSSSPQPLFTGKPHVDGLGHAFLMRNYRAGLGKWLTADPLGYPDGWNQLAYCGNDGIGQIDFMGGWVKVVDEYDDESEIGITDLGVHMHSGRSCHRYKIETYCYHHIIGQNMKTVRRWDFWGADYITDILNGTGYGLEISGGVAAVTGVGAIPAVGLTLGGATFHTIADFVDNLNGWVDKPDGKPFELSKTKKILDVFELHVE